MKPPTSPRHWIPFILILAFPLSESAIRAQERRIIPRLTSEIRFDGMPDEEAWNEVDSFPMITHTPTFGLDPPEPSSVKMAFNDQYIYVGARMLVSDPDLIKAIGKKRDFSSISCDWFGISFDCYNDKENALLFFTNPNGLRWDATVCNDGTPTSDESPMSLSWNTYWDVRVARDEEGWYLEMQIPVSSLRFQEKEGKAVMGISIFRWVPARNESYVFPPISQEWGPYSNLKPSLYAEVEFRGLSSRKPLYISPYLLSGFEQQHQLNDGETGYAYEEDFRFEPGIDIKYGINSNTTLDLTANTDFAQVEADDQQFNLTRFSLVFPEKRPFFLERSSIFDFSLGGPNTLFYSRRIGLHEGSPVRIWGGARLNSRMGEWDIGLMDLQTAESEELPSENFGVFRARRRVINPYSYAGGMVTTRLGVDGTYNVAYGLDAIIRLFGDEYLTVRWAQTFEDSVQSDLLSMKPTRFLVTWERRKGKGFTYSVLATYSGTDFNPGIGLQVFDEYFATVEDLRYTWISPEASWLQNHYLSLLNFHLNDVNDGTLLTYNINPSWLFNSKNNWVGSVGAVYNIEHLRDPFTLIDSVSVPAGTYRFFNADLTLQTPGSRSFNTLLMLQAGEYYDGIRFSPSIQPSWNIGPSMELGGIYRYDRVRFRDRGQSLNNHIAGLRALYMLSTKISFSAFIQYNSAIRKVLSNFRFRYNPKEGTDLYLVFNEGRNTLLDRELPNLPAYDQRNITLKFTYTFER